VSYRTKWPDPDFRPIPKTERFCYVCQRDLKPGRSAREVRWELDVGEVIHPDDWETAAEEIAARRQHPQALQVGLVGLDCAKRLGLEWSRPLEAR